ncbi:MAG: nucleotide exchange factor GrpE [Cocleimonas sp.]
MSDSKKNQHDNSEQLKDEVLDELESIKAEQEDNEGAETENESSDEEVSIDSLQQALIESQAKADENWETVLRMKADLDNQRKRTEKQVEDAHKFAVKKFMEELLPVADSMEMGLAAEGDVEQIKEGVALTKKVFDSAMGKFGLEAVDPLGEKFNPELHQAMAMQPSEEYDEGCVSAVMQKGFTLKGRIVRPAMVMVVKN